MEPLINGVAVGTTEVVTIEVDIMEVATMVNGVQDKSTSPNAKPHLRMVPLISGNIMVVVIIAITVAKDHDTLTLNQPTPRSDVTFNRTFLAFLSMYLFTSMHTQSILTMSPACCLLPSPRATLFTFHIIPKRL